MITETAFDQVCLSNFDQHVQPSFEDYAINADLGMLDVGTFTDIQESLEQQIPEWFDDTICEKEICALTTYDKQTLADLEEVKPEPIKQNKVKHCTVINRKNRTVASIKDTFAQVYFKMDSNIVDSAIELITVGLSNTVRELNEWRAELGMSELSINHFYDWRPTKIENLLYETLWTGDVYNRQPRGFLLRKENHGDYREAYLIPIPGCASGNAIRKRMKRLIEEFAEVDTLLSMLRSSLPFHLVTHWTLDDGTELRKSKLGFRVSDTGTDHCFSIDKPAEIELPEHCTKCPATEYARVIEEE